MATRGSRRQHKARSAGRSGGAGRTYARMPVEMLVDAVVASAVDRQGRPGAPADHLVEALAGRGAAGVDALATALLAGVGAAWERHWQPADVVRAAGRLCSGDHADLVAVAATRHLDTYPAAALPPRWVAQLEGIAPTAARRHGDNWLQGDGTNGVDPTGPTSEGGALATVVEAVALLRCLPDLPAIGPRPGEVAYPPDHDGTSTAPGDGQVDPGVLHRVASLLAKAESTAFPEEAEALTGKAQQLMARHAIDRALVDASRGPAGDRHRGATARRLGVDDPYAGAKAMLLQEIASANRCRSVWTRTFGFATVFGSEPDLDTVELLYTSVLVQSARAMLNASPPGGRAATTRQFRQSFLVSFAHRIGDRLAEAVQSAVDEAADAADRGRAEVLPVLAGREDAAERASQEAYPHVRTARTSAKDAAGWQAGRQAADRADLDLQDTIGNGPEHVLGAGVREGGADRVRPPAPGAGGDDGQGPLTT